jgi:hypothetical protein
LRTVNLLFQDRFRQTDHNDGDNMKQKKTTIGEQLASLSVKYDVYPAELFNALVSAKASGKAFCEELSVEYRGSITGEAIFLIKKDGNVVVQFRVDEEMLTRKDIRFENWMETDKIRKQIAKQNPASPISLLIKDLRSGMKKVNVEAQVLEVPKPQMVHTQFGNSAMLTNAVIADESGKIKLSLWDTQVTAINTGDTIQINNASVAAFKGEPQLRLGKNAVITIIQQDKPKDKKPSKTTSPVIK